MKKTLIAISLFLAIQVHAQIPGHLDSTFAINGIKQVTSSALDAGGKSVAVQPDGKILICGYLEILGTNKIVVSRLLIDGTTDTTFGNAGIAVLDSGGGSNQNYEIGLQSDGKIIVAGGNGVFHSSGEIYVARLNTDGSPDSTFDADGKVVWDPTPDIESVNSMTMQADGKIIITGQTDNTTTNTTDMFVARLDTSGAADPAFGVNGIAIFNSADVEIPYSVRMTPNGKIYISGYLSTNLIMNTFIQRMNNNGSIDSTFGVNGISKTDLPFVDEAWNAMEIQSDGKIVVAGYTSTGSTSKMAIARFDSLGNLDNSFATGGIFIEDFTYTFALMYSLLLQPDGKIVAGGVVATISPYQRFMTLVRLDANGVLDPAFANNGASFIFDNNRHRTIYDIALHPDGRIIAAVSLYTILSGASIIEAAAFNSGLFTSVVETQIMNERIFPNPFSNELKIVLNQYSEATVSFYNMLSKRIIQESFFHSISIDTRSLLPGVYIYDIMNKEGDKMRGKIVKE